MKSVLYTTGAFALLGLGILIADVRTDYDHSANFAAYKTYSWLKVQAQDTLWSDRIQRAVDQQLTNKGLTLSPSGGDVSVAAVGRTREEQTYDTFYNGLGGGWGWRRFGGGLGSTETSVQEIPVGTLSVDMFDSQTKKLVWRGTASDTLSKNPDKNSKKLENDVENMFKKFPPKSRG